MHRCEHPYSPCLQIQTKRPVDQFQQRFTLILLYLAIVHIQLFASFIEHNYSNLFMCEQHQQVLNFEERESLAASRITTQLLFYFRGTRSFFVMMNSDSGTALLSSKVSLCMGRVLHAVYCRLIAICDKCSLYLEVAGARTPIDCCNLRAKRIQGYTGDQWKINGNIRHA